MARIADEGQKNVSARLIPAEEVKVLRKKMKKNKKETESQWEEEDQSEVVNNPQNLS